MDARQWAAKAQRVRRPTPPPASAALRWGLPQTVVPQGAPLRGAAREAGAGDGLGDVLICGSGPGSDGAP